MINRTQPIPSSPLHTAINSQLQCKHQDSLSTPHHLHSSKNAISQPYKDNQNEHRQPILSTPRTNDKTNQKECLSTSQVKLFQEDNNTAIDTTIKPSLNSMESRSYLYDYSKSKEYKEDHPSQLKENLHPQSSSTDAGYSEYEQLLLYQQSHLIVPIEKANDEKFKILRTTKIKRKSAPIYKSAKKHSDYQPCYQQRFNTSLEYSMIKKKKKIHSTKKDFFTFLPLYPLNSNDGNDVIDFPLFLDKDVGIYEYWQAHIVETKADEDIITDNEQLSIANSYIIHELRLGIQAINNGSLKILENGHYLNNN